MPVMSPRFFKAEAGGVVCDECTEGLLSHESRTYCLSCGSGQYVKNASECVGCTFSMRLRL